MNTYASINGKSRLLEPSSSTSVEFSGQRGRPKPGSGKSLTETEPTGQRERRLANLLSEVEWVQLGEDLGLSAREGAVVRQILEGQKLTAIADVMGLGLGTVKTYCCRIYQKLHVSTQGALAVVVLCGYFSMRLARPNCQAGNSHGAKVDSDAACVGRRDDIPVSDLLHCEGRE